MEPATGEIDDLPEPLAARGAEPPSDDRRHLPGLLGSAGTLLPAHLRSLDAIHLASALQLGTDLGSLVSYDQRMLDAARDLGIDVASPK